VHSCGRTSGILAISLRDRVSLRLVEDQSVRRRASEIIFWRVPVGAGCKCTLFGPEEAYCSEWKGVSLMIDVHACAWNLGMLSRRMRTSSLSVCWLDDRLFGHGDLSKELLWWPVQSSHRVAFMMQMVLTYLTNMLLLTINHGRS